MKACPRSLSPSPNSSSPPILDSLDVAYRDIIFGQYVRTRIHYCANIGNATSPSFSMTSLSTSELDPYHEMMDLAAASDCPLANKRLFTFFPKYQDLGGRSEW